jgi:hypothetical protein
LEQAPRHEKEASGGSSMFERRVATALAFLCLALILAQGCVLLRTFYGDPNIYLIYARNIAHGDLFAFNPGEFSSGSTGPLWALVLAVAFLLPKSVLVAKSIGLAVALAAFWLTYRACVKVSGSAAGSVLAAGAVAWTSAFHGLMLYESSLIQCLAAATVWLTVGILRHPPARAGWRWAGLAAVWAAISLTRPDAVVLVALDLAVLLYALRAEKGAIRALVAAALAALLPGALYHGYSYLTTGHLSVSASCRGFALAENASSLGGLPYSLAALRKLLTVPLVIVAGFALWALDKRDADRSLRQTMLWCGGAALTYVVLLTFVVPATFSADRYLSPVLPLVAAMAAFGLRDLSSAGFRGRHRLIVLALVGALLVVPALDFMSLGAQERNRGYDFETIMEKPLADFLNATAPANAEILVYEVQFRYFLREDLRVISLDGITDGKVAPFLATGDMRSFLLRYRPDYWVANDAVFYRPYLAGGLLRRVVEAIGDEEGASLASDGIVFTNIRVSRAGRIPGFAGHRQLFALSYPPESPITTEGSQ